VADNLKDLRASVSEPDHEAFLGRLDDALPWELQTSGRFIRGRLPIWMEGREKAASPWQGHEFRNQRDIVVGARALGGHVIEVKALEPKRKTFFTEDPASWPHQWVYTYSLKRWNECTAKPYAFVMVCKENGAMLALPTTHTETWLPRMWEDKRDKREKVSMSAPKDQLITMDELVRRLGGTP